jgi:hypothetical protein
MCLCLLATAVVIRGFATPLGGAALWIPYLVLGTICPVTLLALTAAFRSRDRAGPKVRMQAALSLIALTAIASATPLAASAVVLVLAVAQLLVMRLLATGRSRRASVGATAVALAVACASWAGASRWLWWEDYAAGLVRTPIDVAGLGLALAITIASLDGRVRSRLRLAIRWPRWSGPLANAGALALLALMSTRSDGLFGADAFHHWGAYVGPAQLVRQGEWLLWDVPSQYGFLSTLTIAVVHLGSVWQSFYVLEVVATFLSATILFATLRHLARGAAGHVFALGVTVGAVFLLPGRIPGSNASLGPHIFPSVGAYRFVWCFVLLGLLLRELPRRRHGRAHRVVLGAGWVAWGLGVL